MINNAVTSFLPCLAASVLLLVSSTGCDPRSPAWRSYEEVTIENPAHHQHDDHAATAPRPSAPSTLAWTKPDGWNETPGSGMRMATFTVTSGGHSATCTLVRLSGAAGGLEANARRWIGQLGLAVPEDAALSAFLERQVRVESEGGYAGTVVDLAELGRASDGSSMLAALIDLQGATLFVKLTGPADLLAAEKDRFIALCRSLRKGS